MPRIELAPLGPFHDLEATVARIRAAHPGITDRGVNQAVKRMLNGYKPRHKGRIVYLFGADIMTAQIDAIPAWRWLSDGAKARLLEHPTEGGTCLPETVDGDDDQTRIDLVQAGLINEHYRKGVNRSVLISPRGLSQTYVWRIENDWLQEVTPADYRLIFAHPASRRRFRDPDRHGPYQDVRSYDGPNIVTHREVSRSMRDVEYMLRQTTAAKNWQGSDLPKQ